MASFVDGTLVADDRWGLVLGEVDGSVREVVWPYGYSARRTGGRRVLFDATGAIVASERDRVRIGGGEMHDGAWLGCGGITVLAGG